MIICVFILETVLLDCLLLSEYLEMDLGFIKKRKLNLRNRFNIK